MKKEESIRRYGKEKYKQELEKHSIWMHRNPQKVKRYHNEANRKGGAHYEKRLQQNREGLQGDRGRIRRIDGHRFRKYKPFFATQSQLHHEWIPGTAKYTGIALVEQDQHMHGFIDVLMILKGEITVCNEHTGAYK